jgi:hypothetical protein
MTTPPVSNQTPLTGQALIDRKNELMAAGCDDMSQVAIECGYYITTEKGDVRGQKSQLAIALSVAAGILPESMLKGGAAVRKRSTITKPRVAGNGSLRISPSALAMLDEGIGPGSIFNLEVLDDEPAIKITLLNKRNEQPLPVAAPAEPPASAAPAAPVAQQEPAYAGSYPTP